MTGQPSAQPDPLDAAIAAQIVRRMLSEIALLTEKQRIVIRLRYFEERAWGAIGEMLSVTEEAVIRLHGRALKRLHSRLTLK